MCLRCCQRMRKSGGARVRARPQGIPAPGPPLLRRTRGRAAFPGPHPHGPVLRPVPSQLPRNVSRAACGFVRRIFQKRFRPEHKTVFPFMKVFQISWYPVFGFFPDFLNPMFSDFGLFLTFYFIYICYIFFFGFFVIVASTPRRSPHHHLQPPRHVLLQALLVVKKLGTTGSTRTAPLLVSSSKSSREGPSAGFESVEILST